MWIIMAESSSLEGRTLWRGLTDYVFLIVPLLSGTMWHGHGVAGGGKYGARHSQWRMFIILASSRHVCV